MSLGYSVVVTIAWISTPQMTTGRMVTASAAHSFHGPPPRLLVARRQIPVTSHFDVNRERNTWAGYRCLTELSVFVNSLHARKQCAILIPCRVVSFLRLPSCMYCFFVRLTDPPHEPRLLRGGYDCLDSNPADDDRAHGDRIRCI